VVTGSAAATILGADPSLSHDIGSISTSGRGKDRKDYGGVSTPAGGMPVLDAKTPVKIEVGHCSCRVECPTGCVE